MTMLNSAGVIESPVPRGWWARTVLRLEDLGRLKPSPGAWAWRVGDARSWQAAGWRMRCQAGQRGCQGRRSEERMGGAGALSGLEAGG